MDSTKHFKCSCQHCGRRIEYPAHAAGTAAPCPHCGLETELTVEFAPAVEEARRVNVKWLLVGLLLLVLGGLGFLAPVLLKRVAKRQRSTSRQ